MIDTDKKNKFISDCAVFAARFLNMPRDDAGRKIDAASIFANAARITASSRGDSLPDHYIPHIRRALLDGFGEVWELADLAHDRQYEAVAAWRWFMDTFDAEPQPGTDWPTIRNAVDTMRRGGPGWRKNLREVLLNDFNREYFGLPQSE